MKILHYVNEGNLAWARPWMQLLEALKSLKVENIIMCPENGTLTSIAEEHTFETKNFTPLISGVPFLSKGAGRIIDEVKPDLVHTRLSSAAAIGGYWAKKCNVPVVATLDKYPKVKYYKNVDHFVGCSKAVSSHIIQLGIAEERVSTIHNPVLFELYQRDDKVREEFRMVNNVPHDRRIILGAGRFVDWKAFDVLIKAVSVMSREDDWVLWLVGDGPERKRLEELVKKTGIEDRVFFWGFAQDIRPYLWASDIFVQPSNKPEGFSLMLLEAMAAGLPAIATSIGGTLDILEDGINGWLVDPDDIKGLSSLLSMAIKKNSLDELGMKASEKASNFKAESIAEQYRDLYLGMI